VKIYSYKTVQSISVRRWAFDMCRTPQGVMIIRVKKLGLFGEIPPAVSIEIILHEIYAADIISIQIIRAESFYAISVPGGAG